MDDIALQIPQKIEEVINNTLNDKLPDMVEQSVQSALKKLNEPNPNLTIGNVLTL